MASKQQKKTTDDASATSAAPAPSSLSSEPAPAAATATTSGANAESSSTRPKVCSSDPLIFLFRLLSYFPSLLDTYYEPSQNTTTA